jgi:hypothetical protein
MGATKTSIWFKKVGARRFARFGIGLLIAAVGSSIANVDFIPLVLIFAGASICERSNVWEAGRG